MYQLKRFSFLTIGIALISLLLTFWGGARAQEAGETLASLSQTRLIAVNSSFVSPLVELFGNVAIGQKSFIASNTTLRADPGTRICIGSKTNLQDNITFLALRNQPAPPSTCGKLSSSTGSEVSIAHQATIKNSQIGKFTFIGFRSRITNSVIEDGAFVLHGATVTGVRIPKDRLVPIAGVITTQTQADALPLKTAANSTFQRDVLGVNEEFAEHYSELYKTQGFDAVVGISQAPRTSWNPKPVKPTIGKGVQIEELVRVVGDVRLGANSVVGRRTSIRADEGSPIIIGENAKIDDRVTFHALKTTNIRIGNNLKAENNIVFHGPLEVGDNLTIGENSILFKSKVGNRVTIGSEAIVVGVTLKDGTKVPNQAVITTQAQADKLSTAS